MNIPVKTKSRQAVFGNEWLLVAFLLAIICAISWPGMTAPLLLDDVDQMAHVAEFKSWKDSLGPDCFGLFRPLKNIIFYCFQGEISLFNWHAFALAAYLGAVLGLYVLFRRMFGSPLWAFAGALLWASCPTQVSTVVWMSAVNLSLAMAFSCACILVHDLSQSRPGRNAGLTVLACALLFLAEISYETAIAVPALCVLVDLLRKRPVFKRTTILRYCALGLVTVAYLAIRSHFGAVSSVQSRNFGFAPDTQDWQISVSAPWFLWRHFSMWLMPAGRLEFSSTYLWGISATPWELAAAWAWLFSIIAAVFLTWKRLPMVAIGLLWFLAASFPPSNFIPIWSGPIEDYYLVFPGVGLVIVVLGCAKALIEWAKRGSAEERLPPQMIGGSLLFLGGIWRILCIPMFWMQADLWNRPAELYLRYEVSRPFQFLLQALAASELLVAEKPGLAKELALQSHQTGPWYPSSSKILGYIALKEGDLGAAEKYLRETLQKTPENSSANDFSRFHLADALQKKGTSSQAVRDILLPLLKNPRGSYHVDAIRLLVDCYLAQNQSIDALRAVRNAIRIHPNDPQFTQLLAKIEALKPGIPADR